MAQNAPVVLPTLNPDSETGAITLTPSRARNGVFEYSGKEFTGSSPFSNQAPSKLSVAVRPGIPADAAKKVQRVKRRTTLKFAFPIMVPNADGSGVVIDYINIDAVLSAPNEANEFQLFTALRSVYEGTIATSSPIRDIVVNGNEPF